MHRVLLTCALVFVSSVPSLANDRPYASEASPRSEDFGSSFVARQLRVELGVDEAFVEHLRECYLPVWNQLRDAGVVTTASVFQLEPYDSTNMNAEHQDYLVLVGLSPEAVPNDLLDAENASACPDDGDTSLFSVQGSALMQCTPNSCYGSPEPAYPDTDSGIRFLVEFIGVEDSPPALEKYREIVSKYAGPANGILFERGVLHCFVALENVAVLSDTPGAVPWNQLHISDDWDEGGEVDWESVYAEIFQTEFGRDLGTVWAELPPTDDTRADFWGRLIPTLCVR